MIEIKEKNLPIIHPTHSLWSRERMPQIKDTEAFLAYLRERHIRHECKELEAESLRPTQNEINLALVMEIIRKGLNTKKHPLVIAKDNYILDGHNRWKAGTILQERVHVIRVDLHIHALLHEALQWRGVKHASVDSVKLS